MESHGKAYRPVGISSKTKGFIIKTKTQKVSLLKLKKKKMPGHTRKCNEAIFFSTKNVRGPTGDRTPDLRFTRPTPYHLATEPDVRSEAEKFDQTLVDHRLALPSLFLVDYVCFLNFSRTDQCI